MRTKVFQDCRNYVHDISRIFHIKDFLGREVNNAQEIIRNPLLLPQSKPRLEPTV